MDDLTNLENQESKVEAVQEPSNETSLVKTDIIQQDGNKQKGLNFNNKKLITIAGICIVALCLAYFVGYSSKVEHEALESKLALEQDYKKLQDDLSKIQDELKDNAKELKDYKTYLQNKAENDKILTDLLAKIESTKIEISDLEKQTSYKTTELEKLSGDILKAKGNPVTLPAGYFIVGNDLPVGRYKVTGSSNFQVYSSKGNLKVNTILGGRIGVEEYVCAFVDGDIMDCGGSNTFTPIE